MQRFLEDETGDQHFGANPQISGEPSNITASALLDGFIQKITDLQVKNSRLIDEVNKLRRELECRKAEQALLVEPKVQQVLQVIR